MTRMSTQGGRYTSKNESHHHNHPPYAQMIKEAITELKNRKGSSRIAILKYISEHYDINQNVGDQSTNHHLNKALNDGLKSGALKHSTPRSYGASGSFKLGEASKKAAAKPKAASKKTENDHTGGAGNTSNHVGTTTAKKSKKTTHANKSPAAATAKTTKKPAMKKGKAAAAVKK